MSQQDSTVQVPGRDEIDQAAHAAYAAEGYLAADGGIDRKLVREAMFEVLRPNLVAGKGERKDKAVTRGALVRQVFPSLPAPDTFAEQGSPALAAAVWQKIYQQLWNEARPGATSAFQKLVGFNMGNGYWLCRTTVGDDKTSAVYITDDYECIRDDHTAPQMAKVARLSSQAIVDNELLIARQPHNAQKYKRAYDRNMRLMISGGHDRLVAAIEAAGNNGSEAAETGTGEE